MKNNQFWKDIVPDPVEILFMLAFAFVIMAFIIFL